MAGATSGPLGSVRVGKTAGQHDPTSSSLGEVLLRDFEAWQRKASGIPRAYQNEKTQALSHAVGVTGGASSQRRLQKDEAVRGHRSLEAARNKTLEEIGDLGHDKQRTRARLGDDIGKVNGFKSADGKRGFRVDYDPDKGVHYNWFDWSRGSRGTGGRWGAEIFPGTQEDYARIIAQLNR